MAKPGKGTRPVGEGGRSGVKDKQSDRPTRLSPTSQNGVRVLDSLVETDSRRFGSGLQESISAVGSQSGPRCIPGRTACRTLTGLTPLPIDQTRMRPPNNRRRTLAVAHSSRSVPHGRGLATVIPIVLPNGCPQHREFGQEVALGRTLAVGARSLPLPAPRRTVLFGQ